MLQAHLPEIAIFSWQHLQSMQCKCAFASLINKQARDGVTCAAIFSAWGTSMMISFCVGFDSALLAMR